MFGDVVHNAIPCCCVLANRHIVTSAQCPICTTHAEDIAHAIFKFGRASEVWKALGLHEIINSVAIRGRLGAEM